MTGGVMTSTTSELHDQLSDPEKPRVRVIALGNPLASDDGAALEAARRIPSREGVEIVLAGRPGPGLLDLLDPDVPTVLMDVVRVGAVVGAVVELPLSELASASIDGKPLSSHGLGVAQALAMAKALGQPLPRGMFLGLGARCFDPGTTLSREVEQAIFDLCTAAEAAVDALLEAQS